METRRIRDVGCNLFVIVTTSGIGLETKYKLRELTVVRADREFYYAIPKGLVPDYEEGLHVKEDVFKQSNDKHLNSSESYGYGYKTTLSFLTLESIEKAEILYKEYIQKIIDDKNMKRAVLSYLTKDFSSEELKEIIGKLDIPFDSVSLNNIEVVKEADFHSRTL